jgi:quercetin dioxygenase-like cupin family protein
MRNSIRRFATLLLPALALGLIAHGAVAQEKKGEMSAQKAAVKEGRTKEIAQNDKVRVIEVTYKPGEGPASQTRPMRVVRCLKGGTIERTYADGTKEKTEWKAGETKIINEPRAYAIQNVGKSTVEFLVVFIK